MSLAQVNSGDRILASDLNAYYQLLKGVAASGENILLIYNAGALTFQPSSDPSAGTEAVQIKNNAGTTQGSLTYDGKVKVADGTAALPSLRMQSEATGGFLVSAGILGLSIAGTEALRLSSAAMTFAAAATRIVPGATSFSHRDNANANDNLLITDAGVVTARAGLAATAGGVRTTTAGVGVGVAAPAAASLNVNNTGVPGAGNIILGTAGSNAIIYFDSTGGPSVKRNSATGDLELIAGGGVNTQIGRDASATLAPMNTGVSDGTGHLAATTRYWKAQ